jgi:trigger factor
LTDTIQKEEFKTENLSITVQRKPFCKIELEIEATPSFIQKSKKKAIKEVGKQVSIPGFRKGKAPEEMILKSYSGAVDEKLHKHLADDAFKEAVKEIKIPPLSNGPKITYDLKNLDVEKGAHLSFSYESEPNVPSVDPQKYTPKEITKQEIGEKEIQEAIRQTQFFYAKWNDVEEREAKEGDFVLIDLESLEDEKAKVFSDTRFEVKKEYMADWMRELVVGMKPGEEKEGVSKPDKDATDKEKKEFQPKKVKLTLKKIEEPELPELDEEFAKKVGTKDIESFKKSLEEMLQKKAEEKFDQEKREDVNKFLLDVYPFELPSSLIEKEKDHRLQQMLSNPKSKKEYEGYSQEQKNKVLASVVKQADDAVRLFYISRKVVHEAKIDVGYEDVFKEAIATMQAYGPMQIDPKNIPQEVYALAFSKVMLKKAQDHILANAKKQA